MRRMLPNFMASTGDGTAATAVRTAPKAAACSRCAAKASTRGAEGTKAFRSWQDRQTAAAANKKTARVERPRAMSPTIERNFGYKK